MWHVTCYQGDQFHLHFGQLNGKVSSARCVVRVSGNLALRRTGRTLGLAQALSPGQGQAESGQGSVCRALLGDGTEESGHHSMEWELQWVRRQRILSEGKIF